jgi:hypothetical protein
MAVGVREALHRPEYQNLLRSAVPARFRDKLTGPAKPALPDPESEKVHVVAPDSPNVALILVPTTAHNARHNVPAWQRSGTDIHS